MLEKVVGILSSRWQPGVDDEREWKLESGDRDGSDTCYKWCYIVFTPAWCIHMLLLSCHCNVLLTDFTEEDRSVCIHAKVAVFVSVFKGQGGLF